MIGKITKKLLKNIPGGSHTYSRGFDQFSSNAPEIFYKGKGAYLFDNKNNRFLDYGMALRAVSIGYSEDKINKAAKRQIDLGNNFTRASITELEASELFLKTIKNANMVKFAKNGSSAVTAAVKLARAFTNKSIILRCSDHPFFSYDDWFIGSTEIKKGIPKEIYKLTVNFKYNNINDLKDKIKKFKNQISCVVLEPSTIGCPNSNFYSGCCGNFECKRDFKKENYLMEVQNLCNENKIVFILDEMITGFRWRLGGAQEMYNVKPDISTFGKAMANGFSIAAVCGKREIMELGSIEKKGTERVFLLSSTFGAEMSSLGAFIETVKFIKKNNVINSNWLNGYNFIRTFNDVSESEGLIKYLYASGVPCSPYYVTLDKKGVPSLMLRTILMQEMIKEKIIFPNFISICFYHNKDAIKKTRNALQKAFLIYKKAVFGKTSVYLKGNSIKPVFRKFN